MGGDLGNEIDGTRFAGKAGSLRVVVNHCPSVALSVSSAQTAEQKLRTCRRATGTVNRHVNEAMHPMPDVSLGNEKDDSLKRLE